MYNKKMATKKQINLTNKIIFFLIMIIYQNLSNDPLFFNVIFKYIYDIWYDIFMIYHLFLTYH